MADIPLETANKVLAFLAEVAGKSTEEFVNEKLQMIEADEDTPLKISVVEASSSFKGPGALHVEILNIPAAVEAMLLADGCESIDPTKPRRFYNTVMKTPLVEAALARLRARKVNSNLELLRILQLLDFYWD